MFLPLSFVKGRKNNSIFVMAGKDEDNGDDDDGLGLVRLDTGGYVCVTCGKVLSNTSNGYRHVRETHRINQQSQCNICQRFYKNDRQLKHHILYFHGKRNELPL